LIERGHSNLRYLLESRQGVSYARNTGIENTRAPIIAFFDDDERVAPDWVARIKRAFDEHPEVDFIGGKVLPHWETEPPQWLTSDHWSVVALADFGDSPFYSNSERPVCLVSANLATRRNVFDKVGLFDTTLQRVKDNIGSMEDHELLMRLWWIGGQGLYVPDMVVEAEVPTKRMSKAYHRKWHTGHGKYCALNRMPEYFDEQGRLLEKPLECTRLFGAPTFVYRELIETSGSWLKAILQGNKSIAFFKENEVRHSISYIRTNYQSNPVKQSLFSEIGSLLKKFSGIAKSDDSRKL
jgi:glycosyltransferase involved in cell wall biosynthesis